jgi:hypothetical protein
MMSRSQLEWWHCTLIGIGFFVVAVIIGPIADQQGYGTFAGLINSILALITCAGFCVVGLIRLVKWVGHRRNPN